ncbi:hypothetical protein [Verrucomicrobium sp. BvORR034]|uniref:hypothetical protein n=1 Tax=Verrucomicrobium sp. BvORR034 TaxID=1396418 RepID=UPI000678D229|nr:hypothetical protein [Verrucomicrobium sp. BvORR034]
MVTTPSPQPPLVNTLVTAGRKAWRKHGKAALVGAAAGAAGIVAGKAMTDRKSDRNWNRGKSRLKNALVTGTGGGFLGGMLYAGKSGFRGARVGTAIGAAAGALMDPKKRTTTGATVASGGDWHFEVLPPEGGEAKIRDRVAIAKDAVSIGAGVGGILAVRRVAKKANETLGEVKPWLQRTWERDVKPVGAKIQGTADQVSQTAKKLAADVGETTRNINSVAKPVGRKLEKAARREGTMKRWRERAAQPSRLGSKPGTRFLGKKLPAVMGTGWKSRLARVATAPGRWIGKSMMLQAAGATTGFDEKKTGAAAAAGGGALAGAAAGGLYLPGRAVAAGEDLTGKRVVRRTKWPFIQHEGIGVGDKKVAEVFHRGLSRNTPSRTHVIPQNQWPKGQTWKVLDGKPSKRAATRAMKGTGKPWNYCLLTNNCQHWTEHARTGTRPVVSRQLRQVGAGALAGAVLTGVAAKGLQMARDRKKSKETTAEMGDRSRTTRFAVRTDEPTVGRSALQGAAAGAAGGAAVGAANALRKLPEEGQAKAGKLLRVAGDRMGGATRHERWTAIKKVARIAGREIKKHPKTVLTGAATLGLLQGAASGLSSWRQKRKKEVTGEPVQFARGEYLDAQGRHVSAWDVMTGNKQAYGTKMDGRGKRSVDISVPKDASLLDAASAVHGQAKAVTRWGGRATGMVKDAGDVIRGKPRGRDASGRPVKREWEKPWFARHAKELATTAALVGSGVLYKRNPVVRKHVNAVTENVKNRARHWQNQVGLSRLDGLFERVTALMVGGGSPVYQFDEVAAEAGWDVRDPRGKSARVFAPGSRSRQRREKEWYEEVGNERKLWGAGVATAGVLGAGLATLVAKKKPGWLGLRKAPAMPVVRRPRQVGNVVRGAFRKTV